MAPSPSTAQTPFTFDLLFKSLTGTAPYPWQNNLFQRFLEGDIPRNINLPTGSGKTSIMAIWLIALACQGRQPEGLALPRRLVWVVNRRVVVDQATEEAGQIRNRLANRSTISGIDYLCEGLRMLSPHADTPECIAVSTLRGEKEDNREWSSDPSRPAIIVGTVDMIGSRLLFSGYGDSRYWRGQHAGLLGHDTLIVNDEAHLTPAFAKLIRTVESMQNSPLKPFRTICSSATHLDEDCWPESLETDKQHSHFQKIYESRKTLQIQIHPAAKLESAMVELATQKGVGRTLVFVTEPEKARRLAATIKTRVGANAAQRVLTLTGTMRGLERDELVKKDEFQVFARPERPQEDYWMVATSAGEVGANISSDRLVTSLDTLDHLLQRFGRLNRFGETEGVAYLISSDKEKHERKLAAIDFLRKHLPQMDGSYDISPKALFKLHLEENACTAPPLLAPLHPWHIDAWSQTSLGSHPSRPEVAPWLHGNERDIQETFVAWREDVQILESSAESITENEDREEILEKYPILSHERLREPTHTLVQKLAILFSKGERTVPVWRCKPNGTVDMIELPRIGREIDLRNDAHADAAKRELAFCQLVFPPGCGRLEHGMFEPVWPAADEITQVKGKKPENHSSVPYDVSGTQSQTEDRGVSRKTRASFLATKQENNAWLLKRLGVLQSESYSPEAITEPKHPLLNKFAAQHGWRFLTQIRLKPDRDKSEPERWLLYFGPENRRTPVARERLPLDQHNAEVQKKASEIAKSIGASRDIFQALDIAGKLHDLGKKEEIWQRAAGNWDPINCTFANEPVAKPLGVMRGRQLGGFRHELASLRLSKETSEIAELAPDVANLTLHLIAAHHGHGRPCFESKAYDRAHLQDSDKLAHECLERFAKLQRQYGAWGLAYIESLLRAADGIASQSGPEQTPNG